ncbi:MAG: methyl-accepting chemotaxis protein [Gammaproteobacteria bacterium]
MINSNIISNISINKKLTILFISVALGFAITTAAYWYKVVNERESTKRTNLFIDYSNLISEAQKNYFKVRRFEKDFLLSISASTGQTYNNAPLDEHAKHVSLLEENMMELRNLGDTINTSTSEEVVIDDIVMPAEYIPELVTQASAVVDNYKSSFSGIVKFNQFVGFTDNDGLRLKTKQLLNAVEEKLDEAGNPKLLVSIANLRFHEKHILQSIDLTESFENLRAEIQTFRNELKRTALNIQNKNLLVNHMDDYLTIVDEIVTNKRNANEYTELYDFMLGPMFDEMGQSSQLSIIQNQAALEKDTVVATIIVSILLIAMAVLITSLLYFFGDSIRKPINKLLNTIHDVNKGNLNARVNSKQKDEFGELAASFDKLLNEKVAQLSNSEQENEELNESVIELIKAVAQLSKKDFNVKVPVSEDVTGAIGDSLNLLTKETADALINIRTISTHVAGVSNVVHKQSRIVMAVAEQERKQVEHNVVELNKSSDAMNKISTDAEDASDRADNAIHNTQYALTAVNRSVEGINSIRDTIRETEKRIKRLGERSQEITGIVNLINSIAERTHILALNASMHASAAGEAGRGFAVVAEEVQRLAESAREATTEIDTLVNNIRIETKDTVTAMNKAITQVADGTQLAEQAGEAMRLTEKSTEDLVKAVEKITVSSKDQANVSQKIVENSKGIVLSTRKTDKYLRKQTINTNDLVKFSKTLLATIRTFNLPARESDPYNINVESIDVPEISEELNKQDANVTNSNKAVNE